MHRTTSRITQAVTIFATILPALVLCGGVAFAQPYPGVGSPGGMSALRIIAGAIMDADGGIPIPGANIMLFPHGVLVEGQPVHNDAAIRGTATEDDGRFRIPAIPDGDYDLLIRALGYETVTIENIEINADNPRVLLGTLELKSVALKLKDVELRVEGTDVTLAPDRKIYRISSSVADAGGSVADALEEIPSVTVDIEGNVSLRGNDNVRILIDGKPSSRIGINPADALKQLPADLVDRVEVMTNPSARYDAQGDAGIINIVLKKERRPGANGSVNVSAGYPESYGAGFNINYRFGKFNLFSNEQLGYRSSEGGGDTFQKYFSPDAPYSTLNQHESYDRSGWNNYIRAGFEYFADDRNTITASVDNDYEDSQTDGRVRYKYYDISHDLVSDILRRNPEDQNERFDEFDLGYRHNFDDKGHELTADYQFETGSEDAWSNITESWLAGEGTGTAEHVDDLQGEIRHLLQSDYVHQINENNRIEAGVKAQLRSLDYNYNIKDPSGMILPVSNHLIYDENIYAGYFTFSNRLSRAWSYQLGLRSEYSDIATDFKTTEEVHERKYLDWFPSAFITYDLSPVNSIQASYSRRLERPRHWFLVPFWNYVDNRNPRRGNPNLDPEYSNSYEISHLLNTETGSISSSLYYRQASGVIAWVEQAQDSVIVSEPFNIGNRDSYGFEFVAIQQMAKWLNMQGSFNIFNAQSTGEFEGISYKHDYLSWFIRLSGRLQFMKSSQLQTRFFYMGPQQTVQGERDPIYAIDLGLSQNLFRDNATLSFNVHDLLDTRKRTMETTTDSFYSKSEFQWRGRTFTLQFTWRFNQDERQKRQQPGPEMDNNGYDDEGGGM